MRNAEKGAGQVGIDTDDRDYPDGTAATIDFNIGQFYRDFIHPYLGAYGSGMALRAAVGQCWVSR